MYLWKEQKNMLPESMHDQGHGRGHTWAVGGGGGGSEDGESV